MKKDIFTTIIGGKAGQGINKAGAVAAYLFTDMHREVFQMNDYPSLIRGGHNFSVVSSSAEKIQNHYLKADLIIALDKKSYDIHKDHLANNGIFVINSDEVKQEGIGIPITSESKKYSDPLLISGISSIAILASVVGISKIELENIIKREYKKNVVENIAFTSTIYDIAQKKIERKFLLKEGKEKKILMSGNDAICFGAILAGLDIYFAYPMTPSTSLLHFFATNGKKYGVTTMQPENELAVANMAIGASFTGARVMVGTSGGGFDLMQEAFSLAGMVEAPVLFYLGQRLGPSTGAPTYTEQADLLYALNPGHGDFPRIVASPGNAEEAFYLTSELLSLIWHFQTPGILLTEKHLAESIISVTLHPEKNKWAEPIIHQDGDFKRYRITKDGVSPLLFPPSNSLIKWNSYEHDEQGFTTESSDTMMQMHEKRSKKLESLIAYLKDIHTVNIYGKDKPYIFTFGSTTMSILEALDYKDIKASVIQPIYLNPFPVWELEKYKDKTGIVVELNSTGQLALLLREKVGLKIKSVVRKYDGRPFDSIELATKIEEVI